MIACAAILVCVEVQYSLFAIDLKILGFGILGFVCWVWLGFGSLGFGVWDLA